MTFTENDVYDCIGSQPIETFDTIVEIENYFTKENFFSMFNECLYDNSELYDLTQIAIQMWKEAKKQI